MSLWPCQLSLSTCASMVSDVKPLLLRQCLQLFGTASEEVDAEVGTSAKCEASITHFSPVLRWTTSLGERRMDVLFFPTRSSTGSWMISSHSLGPLTTVI